jgi:uncharacterized protein (TIGR02001 family)
MRGMKLIGLSLLLVAGSASAELSSTITLTTDYDFRGISQTAEDPALQASLDWANEGGFYAGIWGSNVDFDSESDFELDGYVGFAGGEEDELGYDVGLVYYSYWPDDDDINYAEIYAGVSYNILDAKLWYSDDYVNSGESAYYIEANANLELEQGFGVGFHIGYSDGDAFDGGLDYMDYSVAGTYSWSNFDFELKYVDSDADGCSDVDVLSCDGRLILLVSTTLPWAKE